MTNGVLLDQRRGGQLVEAGLARLIVSIDGLTPASFAELRSGAGLREVLGNVRYVQQLAESRENREFEVGIEFVAMKRNRHEMCRLRELARSVGASFVIVTNLMPYTAEMKDEILYGRWTPAARSRGRSKWNPLISLPVMDFDEGMLHSRELLGALHPNVSLFGHEFAARPPYCRFVHEDCVAVRWDGEVSPCLPLMHAHQCYVLGREKRMRPCHFGNARESSLPDIWRSPQYAAFRERIRSFQFPICSNCAGCELVEANEQDCCGNPFPVCGDCLWAQGIIQCP